MAVVLIKLGRLASQQRVSFFAVASTPHSWSMLPPVYRELREPVPPTMYEPLAQFADNKRPAPASACGACL